MVLKSAAHYQSNTKYYRNLSLTQTEKLTVECTTVFLVSVLLFPTRDPHIRAELPRHLICSTSLAVLSRKA